MDNKTFYVSFRFLSESFTLSETEELEKNSLSTAASRTQVCWVTRLEKDLLFVFDYGYTIKLLLTN